MTTHRELLFKTLKIAIGSAISFFIAEHLGLSYATSAGIITLLTIQNTRRETLKLAIDRILSYLVSMVLLSILVHMLPHFVTAFGIYMFFMVGISYKFHWDGAISVNAVMGTHVLLMEQALPTSLMINEFELLAIGTCIAAVVNMIMLDTEQNLRDRAHEVEREMQSILQNIADHIENGTDLTSGREQLHNLIEDLDNCISDSVKNRNNSLRSHSEFFVQFFELRKSQSIVLLHLIRVFRSVDATPYQDYNLAEFVRELSDNIKVTEHPERLRLKLKDLLEFYRSASLPQTRAEFETRSLLFYGLKEMEEMLKLKDAFLAGLTNEQRKIYLHMEGKD